MLVRYLRYADVNGNFKPWACIVAIGPGKVGYSICHPNDNFDKARAREIAIGRAAYYHDEDDGKRPNCNPNGIMRKLAGPFVPERFILTDNFEVLPESLAFAAAMDEMLERSHRFYKTATPEDEYGFESRGARLPEPIDQDYMVGPSIGSP